MLTEEEGLDSTIGFVHWAEQPHRSDETDVIATLRRAGAIIYCKTTAPTSMMMIETNSLLFGRTLNPLNRDLSPGGSSGGEGALIALRGSVRLPAYLVRSG